MSASDVDSRLSAAELEELGWGLREGKPIDVEDSGAIRVVRQRKSGQDDEEVVTSFRPTAWGAPLPWYEAKKGRLLDERDVMRKRFPRFHLEQNKDGSLSWVGVLTPVRGASHLVEVRYPSDYPFSAPSAYVLRPALEPSPHQLSGGMLCLIHPADRPEYDHSGRLVASNTWLPSATAATVVPLVSVWLGVYELHRQRCHRDGGSPCCSNVCPDWPAPRRAKAGG